MNFDLAKWVTAARNHAGLTQEELAHRVNLGGKANISAFENGRTNPTFKTIWDIGRVCGYPLPQNEYNNINNQINANNTQNTGSGMINQVAGNQEQNNFLNKKTEEAVPNPLKPVYPKNMTVSEALQLALPFAMQHHCDESQHPEQERVDALFTYATMILETYPHYKHQLERISVESIPRNHIYAMYENA